MSDGEKAIVTPAGQTKILRAFGEDIVIHLNGEQTGGRLTMWTELTPPGEGPPAHFHINDDETFYVIEGQVSFFHNGEWQEVGPGGTAFAPRGEVHTFKNVGSTPSQMVMSTTPAGIENFFSRAAVEFAKPGGPDMQVVHGIAAEHGIHFVASS